MRNGYAVKLAADLWRDAYPRRNFFDTDTTNQRKWIAIAVKVINRMDVVQTTFYSDGFDDGIDFILERE